MGFYLIPGATSVQEAANFLGDPTPTRSWERVQGGIRFEDSALSDSACAALYSAFVSSGTSDALYEKPMPPAVASAKQTLQSFWEADPPSLTGQQSATLGRAMLTYFRWKFRDIT